MKLTLSYDEAREIIRNFYNNAKMEVDFVEVAVPSSYKVVLTAESKSQAQLNSRKIGLIKEIRAITMMGLKEAKDESESSKTTILKTGLARYEGEKLINSINSDLKAYFSLEAEYSSKGDVQTLDI